MKYRGYMGEYDINYNRISIYNTDGNRVVYTNVWSFRYIYFLYRVRKDMIKNGSPKLVRNKVRRIIYKLRAI